MAIVLQDTLSLFVDDSKFSFVRPKKAEIKTAKIAATRVY